MADPHDPPITLLLHQWREGDRSAERRLFDALYAELKGVAARLMGAERPDHTLDPTALVHEAYLRLAPGGVEWQDRAHFLAIAARVMRHVLVDYARGRGRSKRGSGARHITLDPDAVPAGGAALDFVVLDRVLDRLEALDERKARFIEMRYLAGLSNREIAEAAGVSERTVKRELQLGRAWLRREVERQVA
ncbi:MAG TPA: ECF-type sigma factor [Longimicrobiales bacterium]